MTDTSSQNRLFWILQISGWAVYAAANTLFIIIPREDYVGNIGILYLTDLVMGFLYSTMLRYFYRNIQYQRLSFGSFIGILVTCSIIGGALWYWTTFLGNMIVWDTQRQLWLLQHYSIFSRVHSIYVYWNALMLMIWSVLYFGIKLWKEWRWQREQLERANLLAQQAQLQMLRYQLNPHFLFNSLNSIRALIAENKEQAKATITELSEFLRYSLVSRNHHEVPLQQEIQAIRHYFAIEKRRYEEKLEVTFDICRECEEYPVLNFLIHPLVENAVKYGMQTSPKPLRIVIRARAIEDKLQIEVANTGRWLQESDPHSQPHTGTGLENVRRRLQNAYANRHELIMSEENGWVTVRMWISKEVHSNHV